MDKKNKYKEREIFRVPENYFEELTEKMVRMADNNKESINPGFFAIARPHMMLAASMIFLVIVSYTLLRFILPDIQNHQKEYNNDNIAEYLINEIDETMLLESVDLADIYTLSEIPLESDIYKDEIIEYLIDENIIYDDIIENL